VIRDWPLIVTATSVVIGLWVIVTAVGGSAGGTPVDTVLSAGLSFAIVAAAAIPHVRIDDESVHVRKLLRVWTVPLTELIGIDSATAVVFPQRVPRLVIIDGSGVVFPLRAFAWSNTPAAYQRAVGEIRARAAALGNELAIDI
jgi:hypothetical protein